jgi:hypothetical protein
MEIDGHDLFLPTELYKRIINRATRPLAVLEHDGLNRPLLESGIDQIERRSPRATAFVGSDLQCSTAFGDMISGRHLERIIR